MRSIIRSVRLGCQIATTNLASGYRLTAIAGDTTGTPSITLSHNEGLLSQINTGWMARATRRPRLPAPRMMVGLETVIEPQKVSGMHRCLDGVGDFILRKGACVLLQIHSLLPRVLMIFVLFQPISTSSVSTASNERPADRKRSVTDFAEPPCSPPVQPRCRYDPSL